MQPVSQIVSQDYIIPRLFAVSRPYTAFGVHYVRCTTRARDFLLLILLMLLIAVVHPTVSSVIANGGFD